MCRHGEHRQDSQRDPGGHGIDVDPEGHPGQDDYQEAREVVLDDVVPVLSVEEKRRSEAREVTWVIKKKYIISRERNHAWKSKMGISR